MDINSDYESDYGYYEDIFGSHGRAEAHIDKISRQNDDIRRLSGAGYVDGEEEEVDVMYFARIDMLDLCEGLPRRKQNILWKLWESFGKMMERHGDQLEILQGQMEDFALEWRYLEFDLEATRRERDEYREKLTTKNE
ncbi:MAG: hypothetical protein LBT89_01385 [Planctomycetaceae bacterium]|jgi:hypothetical protein|nr:hypothetical protein [Planctomycetaceae bacterium]